MFSKTPLLHNIPYPENYPTNQDLFGADAFANALDNTSGKYFNVNDYYNLKIEGTLHMTLPTIVRMDTIFSRSPGL